MSEPAAGPVADIERIFRKLPHRFPFLLIDRVTQFEPGKRLRGLKNVTAGTLPAKYAPSECR